MLGVFGVTDRATTWAYWGNTVSYSPWETFCVFDVSFTSVRRKGRSSDFIFYPPEAKLWADGCLLEAISTGISLGEAFKFLCSIIISNFCITAFLCASATFVGSLKNSDLYFLAKKLES